MRRLVLVLLLLCSMSWLSMQGLKAAGARAWPTLERQLAADRVAPGSALETLIAANQDFSLLRPEEANDKIPVPLWLRVVWRRAHPQEVYSGADPTGGYPHVLREVHEWMVFHQDLVPPPREGSHGAPRLASAGANSRISGAQTTPRSESAIAINFLNPSAIISASNSISASGRQAEFYSADGGATWGQTSLPLQTSLKDAFHSDPTVDWTSDGKAWSMTIGINNAGSKLHMRSYQSANGGATWTFDNTFSGTQTSTDKPMLWVDHSASSLFRDNIYVIWHNGNPAYVNHRTSAGWGSPLKVSGAESTGTAIGGDVKTNSAGDVFAFWPTTGNSRIVVAKSVNGGASFGTPVVAATTFDSYDIGIPSMDSRRALIYVSGGAYKSGSIDNVYATWIDQTGVAGCNSPANEPGSNVASSCKTRVWFARSTNGGSTWSTPVMINNQSSKNDQFNQWLAVDETSGKIGVMYYDTVGNSGRLKTDVWYQSSADNGVTWSAAIKVTTAMTDETVAGADLGNQYGDYNGMSGFLAKFFPSWTDRRSNAKEEVWTAPISDP
ncbi:MAG TPA: sialidase family protein [Thermoanaerobaculia bacterium]|nr:sialidase family protein [Thermoanaerobaculia bacterium]